MTVPPLRVTGKAVARLLEEFRRHLQITLSGPEIGVAEVGCQLRQEPLDIMPNAIPRHNPGHGGQVTQIVPAWRTILPRGGAATPPPRNHLRPPGAPKAGSPPAP